MRTLTNEEVERRIAARREKREYEARERAGMFFAVCCMIGFYLFMMAIGK